MKIVLSFIDSFSKFSRLRLNVTKGEIAGIGVMENVNVALCGMENVDLTKKIIKILGVHISYTKTIQDDLKIPDSTKNIANVIRL